MWSWQLHGDETADCLSAVSLLVPPCGVHSRQVGHLRFAFYTNNSVKHLPFSSERLPVGWAVRQYMYKGVEEPEKRGERGS